MVIIDYFTKKTANQKLKNKPFKKIMKIALQSLFIKLTIIIIFYILSTFNFLFTNFVYASPLSINSKNNLSLIALSPHITELVFEAGAGSFLVGRTSASNYPLQAGNIQIIADYKNLYIEEILKLKQKYQLQNIIALGWAEGNPNSWQALLLKHNIKIIWLPSKTPQDIVTSLALISALVSSYNHNYSNYIAQNNIKLAQNIINQFKQKYSNKNSKVKKIKNYFYPIWWQPLMTIQGNNYINNLLNLCGVNNFYYNNLTMNLNIESVLSNKFDIMLYDQDKILPTLANKIQAQRKIAINADILLRPTVRSIQNLTTLCSEINQ